MKTGTGDSGKERRKHRRRGYDMPVQYTLSVLEFGDLQNLDLFGMGVDMSDEGMGFSTDYPLQSGDFVKIRNGGGSYRPAVVRWVAELDGKFRVGVIFYNK